MNLTVVCVISKKNESKPTGEKHHMLPVCHVWVFNIPLPSPGPTHPPTKYPAVVGGQFPLVITPTRAVEFP